MTDDTTITPDAAGGENPSDAADPFSIQLIQPGQGGGTLLIAVADPEGMDVQNAEGSAASAGDPAEASADAPAGMRIDTPDAAAPSPEAVFESAPLSGKEADVAGVRLRPLGPVNFFLTRGQPYANGDIVMVDMEGSLALGKVVSISRVDPAHLVTEESGKLRPIVRKATEQEITAAPGNVSLAEEAVRFCKNCVRERDLDMKLVDVLIMHDRSKMVFYFTAPARIDFRELVKDLVRKYRTRIELRQIGVRHETQMAGAVGNCGMVCCCRRYLRKFAPVAIKMAKEQNVFLNPVKISGICGRLLCCLAYEQDHYDEFYRRCPKLGKKYQTDKGVMRVLRASLFRESISVLNENNEEVEYPLEEWKTLNPHRPDASQQQAQNAQHGGAKKEREEGGRGRHHDRGRGGAAPATAASGAAPAGAKDTAPASGAAAAKDTLPAHGAATSGSSAPANGAPVAKPPAPAVPAPVETAARADSAAPSPFAAEDDDLVLSADQDDDDSESIFGLAPRKVPASAEGGSQGASRQGHRHNRRRG